MKLPNMALVFAIIMIPITLIFSIYVGYQISTVSNQTSYDTRLVTATRDAIAAFEINTFGDATTDLASSTRRNIQASINTFTNSFAANFNVSGYDKSDVLIYVPALLFTMYDGYYIYVPTSENKAEEDGFEYNDHVLKPYIYYSARYINGNPENNGYDVVINYSLDNYITITGTVKGNYVSKSGYLIDPTKVKDVSGEVTVTENGTTYPIGTETLYETMSLYQEDFNVDGYINYNDRIDDLNDIRIKQLNDVIQNSADDVKPVRVMLKCMYVHKNNQKYYYCYEAEPKNGLRFNESYEGKWYVYDNTGHVTLAPDTIVDELNNMLDENGKTVDDSAIKFYREALEFTNWINGLGVTITANTMIKPDGKEVTKTDIGDPYNVFSDDSTTNVLNPIGDNESAFVQHKLNVMQASILYNLNVAISNYAGSSGMSEIAMPEISESEWDKILTNISMVSFVQGMPIGFKTYNNYAIVTSTNNQMYVSDNSIYYVGNPSSEDINTEHHMANCDRLSGTTITGYPSTEFDMYTINYQTESTKVYDHYLSFYRHLSTDCYYCIVNRKARTNFDAIKSAQLHASARIKYNQFKVTQKVNGKT